MKKEILTTEPVVRNYKDTVFRMLFKDKKELLALYNAVNGTSYTNLDDLEITTLENAIYMSMKNDVSFVVDMVLSLYEHQSTVNPNLPLRDLDYVSRNFASFYSDKDIYSPRLIQLPNPRFIVFYNGKQEQPARKEMRLSDAYIRPEDEPQLELIVTQLNINPGYNDELMEKCPTLRDYMLYVDRVREHQKTMSLKEAVNKAVNECIRDGILADFLKKNKEQVISMSIFEYDEKLHEETMKEIGREEGRAEERTTGINKLVSSLRKLNTSDNDIILALIEQYELSDSEAKGYL
ncbi:MAG: hypothetical protein IJX85_06945 [Lachnospiraceae bacterium]|nr:hypothetical protein [Lachnospiraceae bacterium]